MKPENLKEIRKRVDKIRDRKGKPIEEKIKPLVIGLQRWGIKTDMSCQGHLPPHGFPYPWVTVPQRQAKRIANLVSWQNRPVLESGRRNKNFWVLEPLGRVIRVIPKNTQKSLQQLQRDVVKFGQFLQGLPNNWGKK